MPSIQNTTLGKLQRRLGYMFSEVDLLTQALTHRSHGSNNNERLEFLGDAILNFVIAEDLYLRFETAQEGKLSRLRAKMVKRQTLAEIARELELGEYLIMGIILFVKGLTGKQQKETSPLTRRHPFHFSIKVFGGN